MWSTSLRAYPLGPQLSSEGQGARGATPAADASSRSPWAATPAGSQTPRTPMAPATPNAQMAPATPVALPVPATPIAQTVPATPPATPPLRPAPKTPPVPAGASSAPPPEQPQPGGPGATKGSSSTTQRDKKREWYQQKYGTAGQAGRQAVPEQRPRRGRTPVRRPPRPPFPCAGQADRQPQPRAGKAPRTLGQTAHARTCVVCSVTWLRIRTEEWPGCRSQSPGAPQPLEASLCDSRKCMVRCSRARSLHGSC